MNTLLKHEELYQTKKKTIKYESSSPRYFKIETFLLEILTLYNLYN